jgi:hypothetical protein
MRCVSLALCRRCARELALCNVTGSQAAQTLAFQRVCGFSRVPEIKAADREKHKSELPLFLSASSRIWLGCAGIGIQCLRLEWRGAERASRFARSQTLHCKCLRRPAGKPQVFRTAGGRAARGSANLDSIGARPTLVGFRSGHEGNGKPSP